MSLPTNQDQVLAAVDLGSNSFHLVVATEQQGEMVQLDKIRERVGLAEGLTLDGQLDPVVAQRALSCLQRFGERLQNIPRERVRAVGTATFRDVQDGRRFLKRAIKNLGHPIETLPGKEEARLIYLGVAHSLGDDEAGRLVLDIGGGSTEVIVGKNFESQCEASVSLGCIHHSKLFFGNGDLTRKAFKRAVLGARLEIEPLLAEFSKYNWTQCVGASGTILAVGNLLDKHCSAKGVITPGGLDALTEILCEAGNVRDLELDGLAEDRRRILAGGLAIMKALCIEFEIQEMSTSPGALRDGLLYDISGRMQHEDVRHRSVMALAKRFHTQEQHSEKVLRTAHNLCEQTKDIWNFKRRHKSQLTWGIMLSEIGRSVSYSGYHRHGAYLIQNSDMAGFSSDETNVLAELVRTHRRRTKVEDFSFVDAAERPRLLQLAALIRIAHRLNRIRIAPDPPAIKAKVKGNVLSLKFPKGWLELNSLAQEDLTQEAQRLLNWDLELSFE